MGKLIFMEGKRGSLCMQIPLANCMKIRNEYNLDCILLAPFNSSMFYFHRPQGKFLFFVFCNYFMLWVLSYKFVQLLLEYD